jgi:hypothetical protein
MTRNNSVKEITWLGVVSAVWYCADAETPARNAIPATAMHRVNLLVNIPILPLPPDWQAPICISAGWPFPSGRPREFWKALCTFSE